MKSNTKAVVLQLVPPARRTAARSIRPEERARDAEDLIRISAELDAATQRLEELRTQTDAAAERIMVKRYLVDRALRSLNIEVA